jgi:hypothetical protein
MAQGTLDTNETCSHFQDAIPFRGTNSADVVDDDIVSWSLDSGDGAAPVSGAWATAPPADDGHVFQPPRSVGHR